MKNNEIIENIKNELADLSIEFSDYLSARVENAHEDKELHHLVYESIGIDKNEIDENMDKLDQKILDQYEAIYTLYYTELSDKLDAIETFEEIEHDPYFSDETAVGFYEKIKRGAYLERELKKLITE